MGVPLQYRYEAKLRPIHNPGLLGYLTSIMVKFAPDPKSVDSSSVAMVEQLRQ